MVNYCGRFIKDLSSLTIPLRELTKATNPWVWCVDQDTAFQKVKDALSSNTTLRYFNPQPDTQVAVDALPKGLGAVLMQKRTKEDEWAPVAFASHSLTENEQRYSQIEKEAIGIYWGCWHFHLYVYGHHFTVTTDHKPLIPLFTGSASKPPPRIEKWMLQL